MHIEHPYELEWPLLHTMVTRSVSVKDASKVLGVMPPTAQTSLQHLESIGLVWQLPLDALEDRSILTRDWEITPSGRAVAERHGGPAQDGSRAISGFLSRVWAA
jgi:hypothetical protein